MKRFFWLFWVLVGCLTVAVTACEPNIPNPPQITVIITAVPNEEALQDSVALALTGTAERGAFATQTALAQGNVTLTATRTPTATNTPLPPTETPFLSPTATDTPTATLTPTFAPLPSNTPEMVTNGENGRLRFVNAWRAERGVIPVNLHINDVLVAQSFELGASTNYQSIAASAVRISVSEPFEAEANPNSVPLVLASSTVDVPRGGSLTVVLADLGEGLELIPITEDSGPLASGQTRLHILQADATLLRSNLIAPNLQAALAMNMDIGDTPGPFDLPAGELPLQLFDADNPEQMLTTLSSLSLDSRVNYLLIFLPAERTTGQQSLLTDFLLLKGSTNRISTDTALRFVNAASDAGPISILLDREQLVSRLEVGDTTVSLPASTRGGTLVIQNAGGAELYEDVLGPWSGEQAGQDKIILITDAPPSDNYPIHVQPITFFEAPPPSLTRANLRLIHGLTGVTRTLDLEIRSANPAVIVNEFGVPQSQQADASWSRVIENVSFGTASDYVVRTPNVFDIRLLLSGSNTAQAQIDSLQLLPGAVHDFIAVPGRDGQGVAQLLLLQPDAQISSLSINQADPAVIAEQVEAILTASAPAVTATPTSFNTPTATISPVPTNTPRPSNTPLVPEPQIAVNPAPPNAAEGAFILIGQNFSPGRRYTIRLDNEPENLSGSIAGDGSIVMTVPIPPNFTPGIHTVRVCVDCRPGGAQEERFATFRVADPNQTPTSTPER